MDEQTDTEAEEAVRLIIEMRSGRGPDPDSLNRLLRLLQDRIYGWVRIVLNQDADACDATQQTLLNLVRHIHTFDTSMPLFPWLKTIAVRVANRMIRSRIKAGILLGDEEINVADENSDIVELDLNQAQQQQLHRCLDSLSQLYRAVIVQHYWDDRKFKDIACELDVPATRVRQWAVRARRELLVCMESWSKFETLQSRSSAEG